MDLSKMAPAKGARKRRKRVGRGEASGIGKTCGRGGKGQTARSGGKIPARFEGGQMPLYRRIPKSGFRSTQKLDGENQYNIVNLDVLERFKAGDTVSVDTLKSVGYGTKNRYKAGLKVLGSGKLTKKLTVKVDAISASAKSKIESLGGTVEIVTQ